jgi:hypothetical protein
MPNFVFSFNEFLNEGKLYEGTMRKESRLSEKEQEKHNALKIEFLKKQFDLCKKHKVKAFLDYGSLLGLYRDGKLISNDNDTDIGIFGETVTKEFLEDVAKTFKLQRPTNMDTLINKMFKEKGEDDYHQIPYVGLMYLDSKGKPYAVKSLGGRNVNVVGDFFFYYPYTGGKRITRWPGWEVQLTPEKHFSRLGTVKYDGYSFPIPAAPDEYLQYIYGDDWETPKSNAGVNQKLELISREEGHAYTYSFNDKKFKKK